MLRLRSYLKRFSAAFHRAAMLSGDPEIVGESYRYARRSLGIAKRRSEGLRFAQNTEAFAYTRRGQTEASFEEPYEEVVSRSVWKIRTRSPVAEILTSA